MTKRELLTQIKQHADAQGLTIRALLGLAGVDYATYYRWRETTRRPRAETLARILAVRHGGQS